MWKFTCTVKPNKIELNIVNIQMKCKLKHLMNGFTVENFNTAAQAHVMLNKYK